MLQIDTLRTDFMENPIGFDFDRPLLSWITTADGENKRQSAYRLQVALNDRFDDTLLDTGKLLSDESTSVPLGLDLEPRTRYYWRVMVWDELDRCSAFSRPAFFETGRYAETWQADWIGSGIDLPLLRKSFTLSKPVLSARAYACGVGLYRLRINGRDVSGEQLTPGFNAYDAWLQYQTYDVTDLLREGENAVGALLGNGYYKGRVGWASMGDRRCVYGDQCALIAELIVTHTDGSVVRIQTDNSWRAARSPYLRAEIYDGEIFDARLLRQGWDEPCFDDGTWQEAEPVYIDKELLKARLSVPVMIHERVKPVQLLNSPSGEWILDFGQNMAGWVRFRCAAPEGAEIKLQFGEALYPDNTFYRDNMRSALAECVYISDGKRREYAPCFTFFGFRYAKLTGWPGEIDLNDFTAEAVHSQMDRTGFFECSDARVNRLFLNALWGQKSNFVDVPTDCPQRDERLGWTGDAQVFCATASMNMQTDAFYRKYLYDLAIEQKKSGFVPVVVPDFISGASEWKLPTTGWGDAATVIPWTMYLYYGNERVLAAQYDSMKAWVEYMRGQDTLGVDRYYGDHIGDWLSQDTPDPDDPRGMTPTELLATCYYAYSSELLAKAARVLGKQADAAEYEALAERIRRSFRNEFVTPGGRIAAETQTADLIALHMNMLLEKDRAKVAKHLAERLYQDNLYLTTGFLGTPLLCPVLSENGLNEYAYRLLLNNQCPSWLYEVEHGATTIWERWNSLKPDGRFGDVGMNSFNHYALGAVVEWIYRYMCGINPVESAPGFKRMLIRPMPNSLLSHAKACVRTQYGAVRCGWALNQGRITIEIEVPFNTEAQIELPDADGVQILENGNPVEGAQLVRGSGRWTYEYPYTGETIERRTPTLSQWGDS